MLSTHLGHCYVFVKYVCPVNINKLSTLQNAKTEIIKKLR